MASQYPIEASTLFSESKIWEINRAYYHEAGVNAWSQGIVPHNMTSNSMVGKTYAELILGFLKDLAAKGQTSETVYILELGAGHGRLAYHILKHLEKLISRISTQLPPYCFVLSDIVEENLRFFETHPQFQTYLEQGVLDVSYFDAVNSDTLDLRYAKKQIKKQSLQQPVIAIANYFFDSIPTDLFLVQNETISTCSIALDSPIDPAIAKTDVLLKNLSLTYDKKFLLTPAYEEELHNEILQDYTQLVQHTHLFFPHIGLLCLDNLRELSSQGLMLLTMDKGYFEAGDLDKKGEPEIISHGSFSLWVNYHALGAYCEKLDGKALFPSYANFYLQMGCLLFTPDVPNYQQTDAAYQRFVNDFGPDDFNGIKKMTYKHLDRLTLKELLAMLRLSAYDSTVFIKLYPQLKKVAKQVTFKERRRLGEAMQEVWNMYFTINEPVDLGYVMGRFCYDLAFYKEALTFYKNSVTLFGEKADISYGKALCHYQLRQDSLFLDTLNAGKALFPDYAKWVDLDALDLGAA